MLLLSNSLVSFLTSVRELSLCQKLMFIFRALLGLSLIMSHGKTMNVRRYNFFLKIRVFWNYFESTSIIDKFDARPPVRQQFFSHHRKEDHTQFGPLVHNSF